MSKTKPKHDIRKMEHAFRLVRAKLRRIKKEGDTLWTHGSRYICIELHDLYMGDLISYTTYLSCCDYISRMLGGRQSLYLWLLECKGITEARSAEPWLREKVNNTRLAWLDHIINYLGKL